VPAKPNYEKYISISSKWKTICAQVRNRDGNKCKICDSIEKLHVHHLTYVRLGGEELKDLVTLCEPCHVEQHNFAKELRDQDGKLKFNKNAALRRAWNLTIKKEANLAKRPEKTKRKKEKAEIKKAHIESLKKLGRWKSGKKVSRKKAKNGPSAAKRGLTKWSRQ